MAKKRVNADNLRYLIITQLTQHEVFKSMSLADKDKLIETLISMIDICSEGNEYYYELP